MAKVVEGNSQVLFHGISWHFRTSGEEISDDLKANLKEEAEDKARNDIIAGFIAGELCFYDYDSKTTYYGWWSFE